MASTRITTFDSLGETLAAAAMRADTRTRRLLLAALVLSLAAHLAMTQWPVDLPTTPDATPLTATITEMPPPPKPVVAAAQPPPPKPRRVRPGPSAPPPAPAPEVVAEATAPEAAPPVPAEAAPSAAPTVEAREEIIPGDIVAGKTLPPRVDLAYKVYWGTQGFMIGEAVYRFEHAGNRYRISTLGEARGLAALVLRGQGRIESRGIITDEGLQPQSFRVERGGPDRVETAIFDWEAGIVMLHQDKTAELELPTFDPLSLMWQYYFTPPTEDRASFAVATPRRVYRYTMTREASDTIQLPQGPVVADRWHRRSEDGKTDAYVWLASSLRYIPIKMRVSHTDRGTIEVKLDAIRVDESATGIGGGLPEFSDLSPPAAESRRNLGPTQTYEPSATFPEMTGQ